MSLYALVRCCRSLAKAGYCQPRLTKAVAGLIVGKVEAAWGEDGSAKGTAALPGCGAIAGGDDSAGGGMGVVRGGEEGAVFPVGKESTVPEMDLDMGAQTGGTVIVSSSTSSSVSGSSVGGSSVSSSSVSGSSSSSGNDFDGEADGSLHRPEEVSALAECAWLLLEWGVGRQDPAWSAVFSGCAVAHAGFSTRQVSDVQEVFLTAGIHSPILGVRAAAVEIELGS